MLMNNHLTYAEVDLNKRGEYPRQRNVIEWYHRDDMEVTHEPWSDVISTPSRRTHSRADIEVNKIYLRHVIQIITKGIKRKLKLC